MTDNNPNAKNNTVICHCTETSRAALTDLIQKGFDTLESVSRMTGACSGCGACEMAILELIAEHN